MITKVNALLRSLQYAPLLVDTLPEAAAFDRTLLSQPAKNTALNFDQKLGHLYEEALQNLIEASPQLKLLASHLQIFGANKQTLGELDFLILNQTSQRHIHLELAVKFYLAEQTTNGDWHYPGPDRRDNWHRKLSHMQNHQLTLCQRPEAKALLQQRFNIDIIETQQLIYGCIFHPANQPTPPTQDTMSTTKRTGKWLRINQWHDHFSDTQDILLIPKPLWPIQLSKDTAHLLEPATPQALITLAQDRCTMFTLPSTLDPWFLTPNNWA